MPSSPRQAPYGYRYVRDDGQRGRWEINEDEAPLVRELFGWVRDEGISIRQATKRLIASPSKPRGQGLWTPSTVRNMLTNEDYIGVTYYNRTRWKESKQKDHPFENNRLTKRELRPREEWIPIDIPVLIDKETFDRVQEQLKKNKKFSPRNLKRKDEFLLRRLVRCGVCGLSLTAVSQSRYTSYRCPGKTPLNVGRAERCPSPGVHATDLDTAVWQAIKSLLQSPALMTNAWQHQQKHGGLMAPDVIEAELQRLHIQTVDAERQIRRLVDGYQIGALRQEELSKRRVHLDEKIAHWEHQRQRLESERPKWKEWKTVSENLSSFCKHVLAGLPKLNFEQKQKLLRKIVERITITAGQVTIKLAIPLSTNFDLTPSRPDEIATRPERKDRAESRYIPSEVRERVFERAGYQCQYRSADGTRCSARTRLEIEHERPFAIYRSHEERFLRVALQSTQSLRGGACLRCRVHAEQDRRKKASEGFPESVPGNTLTSTLFPNKDGPTH